MPCLTFGQNWIDLKQNLTMSSSINTCGLKLKITPVSLDHYNGAAWRAIQEGGFAVELSLLVGCGLKTHDVNPNRVWTSY
jgi:hypothetical protein